MNTKLTLLLVFTLGLLTSNAAVVTFDLSPSGSDNAIGLSPLNETPPVTNSVGSGNEIGSGITFDSDTLTLSLSVGYGSAFGFTDLTGPATLAHIHGPALVQTPAGILFDLAGLHVPATNPATGGSLVGNVVLTTNQATELLSGLYYINVHTALNPLGEIRGQLIPVNTLLSLVCPAAVTAECAGGNGTLVNLTAQVADADGDALTVVWSVNGVAIQTNNLPAGTTNLTDVSFQALYNVGTNEVSISVSDGFDTPATCSTTVAVVDTTPPTIVSASVTPNVLWPPNHQLIPVQVSVTATDICGTVSAKIKSIRSSQGVLAKGSGHTSPDWIITGDLTALIRAERSGNVKSGRTYTIQIESTDDSGNSATRDLTVFVPHDQGKHGAKPPKPPKNPGHENNSNGDKKPKKN